METFVILRILTTYIYFSHDLWGYTGVSVRSVGPFPRLILADPGK